MRACSASIAVVLCVSLGAGGGCRSAHPVRQSEYRKLSHALAASHREPAAVERALSPIASELAGPHALEEYIALGLEQNPRIQAARMRVEQAAARVPQAASLEDPRLTVTAQAQQVQTAAGQQEMSVAASQKVPWFGKLETSSAVAHRGLDAARAQLRGAELEVVEQIKRAYYELYFVQQAIALAKQDKSQLQLMARIVERRYTVDRAVSQQDLLRLDVELARLEAELVRRNQSLQSQQAHLAKLLHVSPETEVRALDSLAAERTPPDIEALYRQAIRARPQLQAQLARIARDRCAVERARLNYYPDVTWGVTWIDTSNRGLSPVSNGRDAVLLSAGVNLPIYKKRVAAGVREAEAAAVAGAREYDALKDETLQGVKDLFAQATSQQDLLKLFREDILPKAQRTFEQSMEAYQVGEVDFLQMVDNWRQLLRFQLSEKQLEAQLHQSLASLARLVGSVELSDAGDVVTAAEDVL